MPAAIGLLMLSLWAEVFDGLLQLATLPDWLQAALEPDQVIAALASCVPAFVAGELKLRGCKVKRLILKDTSGRWAGSYQLTVEQPQSGQRQTVALRGTLTAPGRARPAGDDGAASAAFGAPDWRCYLPQLGLDMQTEPPETALAAMPQLTDPEQARALLEESIRAGSPAYRDLRLRACTPHVISYKPGSRCTIRYHLEYPDELADRGWPMTVIAKTYRGKKGQNAYDGMLALWRSSLSQGDIVTIAEPLAYVPELKLLVQGPIHGAESLEDLLKSALRAGAPEALEEARRAIRMTAAGLAVLHQSGARHGETITWEDRLPDIHEIVERLVVPMPELANAATPLIARLEALAARCPADPLVPTHGTFDPEQVLIDGEPIGFIDPEQVQIDIERIGFIDFDDFCLAEPAMDVGLFLAAIIDLALKAGDEDLLTSREARLARLDQARQIGEVFLSEYEALAPISRQRVALWEATDFLIDALHAWTKVKLAGPDNDMLILEHHLRSMDLA